MPAESVQEAHDLEPLYVTQGGDAMNVKTTMLDIAHPKQIWQRRLCDVTQQLLWSG
jgi:hypothetical protein